MILVGKAHGIRLEHHLGVEFAERIGDAPDARL